MAHERSDTREIAFLRLMPYRLVKIQKVVYHRLIVHMVRNSTETVIFRNSRNKVFPIVLTECLIVPYNALDRMASPDVRLADNLVKSRSDPYEFLFFHIHQISATALPTVS